MFLAKIAGMLPLWTKLVAYSSLKHLVLSKCCCYSGQGWHKADVLGVAPASLIRKYVLKVSHKAILLRDFLPEGLILLADSDLDDGLENQLLLSHKPINIF